MAAASFSSLAESPLMPLPPYTPEMMQIFPPAGIQRSGQNCGLNALVQFLTGAPRIVRQIGTSSELGKLMQKIYAAQVNATTVDSSFGDKLRAWIGENLTDGDKAEWDKEGYSSNDKQIDVLIPLHCILEKAEVRIRSIQQKFFEGFKILEKNETSERQEENSGILFQLSMGELDFEKLFQAFFQYPTENGETCKRQLKETPNDLIIEAQRYFQVPLEGEFIAGKEERGLKNVPTHFPLPSEYTANNENAAYRLKGCFIHSGTLEGGHYTYLRRVEETWYHIDDAKATEIEDPSDLIAKGYVFHFEKVS